MVDHQIDDHPDARVLRGTDQLSKISQRSQSLIDVVVIHDVIAVVAVRRRIERKQPNTRGSEAGDVINF
jgi:hypothetical protein